MNDEIRGIFEQSAGVIRRCGEGLSGRIELAVALIVQAYRQGGGVFVVGNGGSAADAQHIAGELVGRFLRERPPLRAEALTTDASVLTAIGNDYAFEQIFSRPLAAKARKGDVLIALSTSGNSANIVAAMEVARQMGVGTIALTGRGGGKMAALADVLLDVPIDRPTPRVQEAHTVIYHILCELVENILLEQPQ